MADGVMGSGKPGHGPRNMRWGKSLISPQSLEIIYPICTLHILLSHHWPHGRILSIYVNVLPTSLQAPSIHFHSSGAKGKLGTCLLNDLLAKWILTWGPQFSLIHFSFPIFSLQPKVLVFASYYTVYTECSFLFCLRKLPLLLLFCGSTRGSIT